jgi:hypothetical protein
METMDELLIAILGFVVLLGLILVRVPIAAAMALVGTIGFLLALSGTSR